MTGKIAPDEFLDQEFASKTKHMYYRGVVMPSDDPAPEEGSALVHWALAGNLLALLHAGLRGRGCRVAGSGLVFQARSGAMLTNPDVTVICGAVRTVPRQPHIVTNPIFVAEVLSPSTESIDRGAKSREYRASASLRQYALISQDQPWVEIHTRDEGGFWRINEMNGLEGGCAFTELDCVVPMAELYEGVLDIQPVE